MLDQKMAKKQEAQRKHIQAFIDRFKAKASKARQAQSRVKMLEKMAPIATVVTSDVLPINIPAPDKLLSPPIVALDDVSVGYVPGKPVLQGPDAADRQRRPHRAARAPTATASRRW